MQNATSTTIKGFSKTDQKKLTSSSEHQRQLSMGMLPTPEEKKEEEKLKEEMDEDYKERLKTDPSLKKRIENDEFGPSFEEELENYGLSLKDVEFEDDQ
ncbi:MAG: hypothetical protein ABEJ56_00130 [Candidatus Nanohaloarchaea archaeon]